MTTPLLTRGPNVPADSDERITRAEAARRLGVHPGSVDRYANNGLLDRQRNPITRRVTFSARLVEELRQKREG